LLKKKKIGKSAKQSFDEKIQKNGYLSHFLNLFHFILVFLEV